MNLNPRRHEKAISQAGFIILRLAQKSNNVAVTAGDTRKIEYHDEACPFSSSHPNPVE